MTIGKGDLQRRVTWNHAQSVISEMEVANHFGAKHARDVRGCGGTAARSNLFGHAAPADQFAPFEHESGISGPRNIGGCGQAVVTRANDDDVVTRIWADGHTDDRWSSQTSATVNETIESPRKKRLKNGRRVLYRLLTGGQ